MRAALSAVARSERRGSWLLAADGWKTSDRAAVAPTREGSTWPEAILPADHGTAEGCSAAGVSATSDQR